MQLTKSFAANYFNRSCQSNLGSVAASKRAPIFHRAQYTSPEIQMSSLSTGERGASVIWRSAVRANFSTQGACDGPRHAHMDRSIGQGRVARQNQQTGRSAHADRRPALAVARSGAII